MILLLCQDSPLWLQTEIRLQNSVFIKHQLCFLLFGMRRKGNYKLIGVNATIWCQVKTVGYKTIPRYISGRFSHGEGSDVSHKGNASTTHSPTLVGKMFSLLICTSIQSMSRLMYLGADSAVGFLYLCSSCQRYSYLGPPDMTGQV